MIIRERLEELIKNCAVIYGIEFNKVEIYDLSDEDICISPAEFRDYGLRVFNSLGYWTDIKYEDLFETKEEAEWYKEFGCIERTIKLDLPKWEDIEKDKNFHYIRHFILTKNFSFFIEIYKFTNTISVSWSGGCKKTDPRFDRNWELTKENYIKACRNAKELFLGDSNEKQRNI